MTQYQHTDALVTGLNQQSLAQLPSHVDTPTYDRSAVKAGIVHIGVGGFHRAHQAVYVNELLKTPGSEQWGICGVGLLEGNRGLRDILKQQDYLYTLTVRHPDGTIDNKVIGSMIDFLFAPEDKQVVINKLAHSDTKIVSLTITEGGYNFNPATGEFDYSNPDIINDINNPNDPITAFGYITAALKLRKEQGLGAFTVHRITPVSKKSDIDYVVDAYGVSDEWPITCESFTQWVIEDTFSDSRPNWDVVGAQFVTDVTPYETMKIRLLNAGHSVLGLLGSIHGYGTIDETVSDELFATYLRAFMDKEVTPNLEPLEGIDLESYKDTLIERFANPNIKDSLARICSESSAKLPKFLIATINENLVQGRDVSLATLVIATWCLYSDKGLSENGEQLEIQDAMHKELNSYAQETQTSPIAFLKLTSLFGKLEHNETFTAEYKKLIAALYAPNSKIKAIMQAVLDQKSN